MQISARNNWPATVDAVEKGPVSAEVHLELETGDPVVAIITTRSADTLELSAGKKVRALVKASSVLLLTGTGSSISSSARNHLEGKVTNVEHGAVNSVVELRTDGGTDITASITKESAEQMGLVAGKPVAALIKASAVLLMID